MRRLPTTPSEDLRASGKGFGLSAEAQDASQSNLKSAFILGSPPVT